jgi:hypothetical protein
MTNTDSKSRSRTTFQRFLAWLADCRFVTVSLLVHAFIVLGLGGAVLYHVKPEPEDIRAPEGIVGHDETLPIKNPDPIEPVNDFNPPAPSMPMPKISGIVTTSTLAPTFIPATASNVSVPGMSDAVKDAIANMSNRIAEGSQSGSPGKLGGKAITFFNVKTTANRIAFLVDYSGSMEGPFRQHMEEELEKSLKGLPAGTEVLIIPWAGGAWLCNQVAPEIASKWERLDNYDNFAIRKGEKLERPQWVTINPDNVRKLMKGIEAQKSWPGGTDWRSPFNYMMEVKPAPDTVFFMTDGQIQDVPRAMREIDKAMKKASPTPKVFALWISNPKNGPEPMKELAKKYQGEFREVGGGKGK